MNAAKLSVVFLMMICIASVSGISWAEESGASNPNATLGAPPIARLITGNIGRLLVLRSELNVTNEQRAKIRAAVRSHKEEMRPIAASIVEKKRAVREAVLSKNEAAIRTASAELGKSIGDASVVASKVVEDARKVLTPEQIEKIRDFRASADKAADRWLNEMGK